MATKLDLNASNVIELDLTVEDARQILDGNDAGDFEANLDEAQGMVYGSQTDTAYLVIKITR